MNNPNTSIHILTRGVISTAGHLLLARAKGAANTFLPGGHVELGESLAGALVREIAEEIGCAGKVSDYLGLVEHQWGEGPSRHHELNHVFAVSLEGVTDTTPLASREDHLEFLWVRPADLSQHNLLPVPLNDFIQRHGRGERGPFWACTFPSR